LDGNNYCPDVWDYPRKHLIWEWQKKKDDIRNMEKMDPNHPYRISFAGELRQWKATLAELEERIRKDLPKVWAKINGPMAAKETLAELEKRICDELPEDCEDLFINGRMAAMEQRRAAFNRQMAAMEKQRAAFNRQMASMDK